MSQRSIYQILSYFIAAVWFINGFFCKILNLVPRHKEIVASILGAEYANILIIMIGMGEVFLAIWILTRLWSRISAMLQILLVITMNVLEFTLTSELLLWGKLNSLFAIMFAFLVYYHEFILFKKIKPQN